jgi:hypothetical protein
MEVLIAAAVVAALLLFGSGHFGLAGCALFVAAFLLWWSGQPGPSLDEELAWVPEERPKAKDSRRR